MIALCNNKKCPLRSKCARGNEKPAPGQPISTFNFTVEKKPFTEATFISCPFQKFI